VGLELEEAELVAMEDSESESDEATGAGTNAKVLSQTNTNPERFKRYSTKT
jgi:hypothetical protein